MWMAFLFLSVASAQTNSSAFDCLRQFIDTYNASSGYSTKIKKTEYEFGDPYTENIEVTEKNKHDVTVKFLDRGSSGIRNNGMTVAYKDGDKVSIELGHSHGLGFVLNGLADAFTSKTKDLTDPTVLQTEVFTVNRAGFGYFARILKGNLAPMREGKTGQLEQIGSGCQLAFHHDASHPQTVTLKKNDPVFPLEEKYGTLAYIIYKENQDKFKNFSGFFHRKEDMTLKVEPNFTDWKMTLDERHLPKIIDVFFAGKPIGHYEFSDIQLAANTESKINTESK